MYLKIFFAMALSIAITFLATAYFVRTHTNKAFKATVFEMEAFNDVGRVEAWDRLEQLLVKGCNSEALELVRFEQTSELLALKYDLNNDAKLIKKIEERNASVVKRANDIINKGEYQIPSCN